MNNTMQHHQVTLIPREDKLEEASDLLLQCAKQVSLKKDENGPISWCASFDENTKHFFVDALFANQEAVDFHVNNIQFIVAQFGELMAAPPETTVKSVFSIST